MADKEERKRARDGAKENPGLALHEQPLRHGSPVATVHWSRLASIDTEARAPGSYRVPTQSQACHVPLGYCWHRLKRTRHLPSSTSRPMHRKDPMTYSPHQHATQNTNTLLNCTHGHSVLYFKKRQAGRKTGVCTVHVHNHIGSMSNSRLAICTYNLSLTPLLLSPSLSTTMS